MRTLVLASTFLLAFAAPAFAQDTTRPSGTDSAPTGPTTVIERGGTQQQSTTTPTPRAKHRVHRHAMASQQQPADSSAVGNPTSDDSAGPTTVIKH